MIITEVFLNTKKSILIFGAAYIFLNSYFWNIKRYEYYQSAFIIKAFPFTIFNFLVLKNQFLKLVSFYKYSVCLVDFIEK